VTENSIRRSALVVEDEPKLAQILIDYLNNAEFDTRHIANGDEVVEAFKSEPASIVLLDLMLPGKDGIQICRELRDFSDVPIIMITARVEEIDRLLGLELGADDYICKPFSPREVIARVNTVLRRLEPRHALESEGTFVVDYDKLSIVFKGQVLNLTQSEFILLSTLTSQPGRVYSRNVLLDKLSAELRDISDRAIDSHIKNLRKKMSAIDAGQDYIQSIYGVGYKLEA